MLGVHGPETVEAAVQAEISQKGRVQVMALVWVLEHIALLIVLFAVIIYRRYVPDPAAILN